MIERLGKKVEIVKSKLFGFIAVAGGSWAYAIKLDINIYLTSGLWLVFIFCSFGIVNNFLKLGSLYTEIERI